MLLFYVFLFLVSEADILWHLRWAGWIIYTTMDVYVQIQTFQMGTDNYF